jgi:hypothetical protein
VDIQFVSDFRLPISNWAPVLVSVRHRPDKLEIGNRKSETNRTLSSCPSYSGRP